MDDREFTAFDELEKLSDEELRKEVIQGVNLHIHTSKSSVAKRILEDRIQQKQLQAANHMETVTKQLELSNKELANIVGVLSFIRKHWLPKKSAWVRLIVFLFGTVLIGILLNLIATWIAKFILNWK